MYDWSTPTRLFLHVYKAPLGEALYGRIHKRAILKHHINQKYCDLYVLKKPVLLKII